MKTTQPHGLGPTRARVLSLLQGATAPRSVSDIADELGLHRNSARFHLDALVAAGYAERAIVPSGAQGRPPLLYAATQASPTLSSMHLLELADVLLTHVAASSPDAKAATREAGCEWGASVAEVGLSACELIEELARHLAERGFGTEHDGETLTFRRCPFRGAVGGNRMPLVCAIHQGFLDGYLKASGAELKAGELEIGSEICTVTVTAR
ncbi:MAG: helix-turn-helix domain-containing protein [Tessaracoccus sp.]|uniref:helix-turn-helix transcriptional regulator n=1 Tax=Tessaracoccus sp. TaxID=1971211 RepID=UPI001ECA03EF|nr:helix-turn-helix domain-containing protein [Tessaracoccus sp.]MBK7822738.1 helix-turn-helix domain-containing protein [Tessaracoccus sp.]